MRGMETMMRTTLVALAAELTQLAPLAGTA
jgi:hypothetical protein